MRRNLFARCWCVSSIAKRRFSELEKNRLGAGTSGAQENDQTQSESVKIRGRLRSIRVKGKLGFMVIYDPAACESMQVVVSGKEACQHARKFTLESVITATGKLVPVQKPVEGTSCQLVELHSEALELESLSDSPLPFPLHDTSAKLDTRLDHRFFDMRTALTQSIFRLQDTACRAFRETLQQKSYVEIHTPKLIGCASEGGSNVFKLPYFDGEASLAQSPQLYKQMAVNGDFPSVFEVGSVFRAENSNSHRHLTEFIGLDVETALFEDDASHLEVVKLLETLVLAISQAIFASSDAAGLSALSEKFPWLVLPNARLDEPFTPSLTDETIARLNLIEEQQEERAQRSTQEQARDEYNGRFCKETKVLRLSFADSIRLLQDDSEGAALVAKAEAEEATAAHHSRLSDLTTPLERRLGAIVRDRYGVDALIVDQYMAEARPFYTMLADANCKTRSPHEITRSFDLLIRGEECCSGAQREHRYEFLLEHVKSTGVDPKVMAFYLNSFRFGSFAHGGFGIGLERIVAFMLGINNVRCTSLFPRDPKRVSP